MTTTLKYITISSRETYDQGDIKFEVHYLEPTVPLFDGMFQRRGVHSSIAFRQRPQNDKIAEIVHSPVTFSLIEKLQTSSSWCQPMIGQIFIIEELT